MADPSADPADVVRDALAWSNGDESKIDAIAEDVDVYGPGLPEGEVHSRAEFASFLEANREGFTDDEIAMQELVAGDEVVMVELTVSGTHTDELMGIPPTYREMEITTVDKFVVEDGQVVEWRSYFDSQEIPEQLGLSFPGIIGQFPKLAWRKIRSSI
jgi:steroid delta-isomerase-like uncharacterized protein